MSCDRSVLSWAAGSCSSGLRSSSGPELSGGQQSCRPCSRSTSTSTHEWPGAAGGVSAAWWTRSGAASIECRSLPEGQRTLVSLAYPCTGGSFCGFQSNVPCLSTGRGLASGATGGFHLSSSLIESLHFANMQGGESAML